MREVMGGGDNLFARGVIGGRQPSTVMAGLVPAIHESDSRAMLLGFVYFMTNRPNGILYVGVTSDVLRRAYEHREGLIDGFTKRYRLHVSSMSRSTTASPSPSSANTR